MSAPSPGRGPLGSAKPLSLSALDAAISETIGRPVRGDRLARDDRVFRWAVRRAIAEGQLRFNCTYAEAAAGAGYEVPRLDCRANRREARHRRVSTVFRALGSLQAAGLVRFGGLKRSDGRWRCLTITLLPAAFSTCPPFGRSRRGPSRRPGGRISFSRRSGTSPTVGKPKSAPESVDVRGRAREGPRAGGEEGWLSSIPPPLAVAAEPDLHDPRFPEARPWPHPHFAVRQERAAILASAFERHFGIPARFSYRHHGPQLERILDRLDRAAAEEPRFGFDATGRRRTPGAGLRAALKRVRRKGLLYRRGNRKLQRVGSLAYLLPELEQLSKRARRAQRADEGREVWGPVRGRDPATEHPPAPRAAP